MLTTRRACSMLTTRSLRAPSNYQVLGVRPAKDPCRQKTSGAEITRSAAHTQSVHPRCGVIASADHTPSVHPATTEVPAGPKPGRPATADGVTRIDHKFFGDARRRQKQQVLGVRPAKDPCRQRLQERRRVKDDFLHCPHTATSQARKSPVLRTSLCFLAAKRAKRVSRKASASHSKAVQ